MLGKLSLVFASAFALTACNSGGFSMGGGNEMLPETPSLDYVQGLDVSRAQHNDSFLSRLALNYRSFAIFNADAAGDPDTGERFAQKAISAFQGELPYPEDPGTWNADKQFAIAYDALIDQLRAGAPVAYPDLAAETQVKFDCWIVASSTGLDATANECGASFDKNISALADRMEGMTPKRIEQIASNRANNRNVGAAGNDFMAAVNDGEIVEVGTNEDGTNYKTITNKSGYSTISSTKDDGRVVVVNNINIPENLIRPIPVTQPVNFNQNIYHNGEKISASDENLEFQGEFDQAAEPVDANPNFVSRDEFINMMLALREELAEINGQLGGGSGGDWIGEEDIELTLKVQQVPLNPEQKIMEEVFEVRFDFAKSDISPEYQEVIKKLATATQANKNMRVSVVGHTDTMGSDEYNYVLGGKRAAAVKQQLIKYGIPASQIVSISAGERELKVATPDNTPNAENRRVRVVKEYPQEQAVQAGPVASNIKVIVEDENADVEIVELDGQRPVQE